MNVTALFTILLVGFTGTFGGRMPQTASHLPPNIQTRAINSIYEGCGETRTCFGVPDNCLATQSCNAVTAVTFDDGKYFFEIKSGSENHAYVAAALSLDTRMEDDSAMECVPENGVVNMYTSWTHRGPSGATRVENTFLHLIDSSYIDGVIYCKIERDQVSEVNGVTFDLLNENYHLLVATGNSLRDGSIGSHNIGRAAAAEAANLTLVTVITTTSDVMVRLHGAFMVTAWMGTAAIGIILARYFKQNWSGSQLCGKDQWFAWHRICMTLTWALTVAGFVIIFVEIKGWSDVQNPHAILGVITTAICFIQPFGAAFRPGPKSRNRPFFNWIHWLGGNFAHVTAIMTIFYAVRLTRAQLPEWLDFILVAYVAFHVIIHSIFSFSKPRTIWLVIYMIAIILFVVTGIVVICLAPL